MSAYNLDMTMEKVVELLKANRIVMCYGGERVRLNRGVVEVDNFLYGWRKLKDNDLPFIEVY